MTALSRQNEVPDGSDQDLNTLTYEEALAELEQIVAALESNEHPLEQTLGLFERGQRLAQHCSRMLDEAELKVQQISGDTLNTFQEEG